MKMMRLVFLESTKTSCPKVPELQLLSHQLDKPLVHGLMVEIVPSLLVLKNRTRAKVN
jgi:hypothetical protein